MSSLVTLFYTSEESARIQEAHTDHIIDTDLTQESKEEEKKDEEIEETVARCKLRVQCGSRRARRPINRAGRTLFTRWF